MQISYSECTSIEKRFLNIFPDTKVKRQISRNNNLFTVHSCKFKLSYFNQAEPPDTEIKQTTATFEVLRRSASLICFVFSLL